MGIEEFIIKHSKTKEDRNLASNIYDFYKSFRAGKLTDTPIVIPKLRTAPYNPSIYWDAAETIVRCEDAINAQCMSCSSAQEVAVVWVLEPLLNVVPRNREEYADAMVKMTKELPMQYISSLLSMNSSYCSPVTKPSCAGGLPTYRIMHTTQIASQYKN